MLYTLNLVVFYVKYISIKLGGEKKETFETVVFMRHFWALDEYLHFLHMEEGITSHLEKKLHAERHSLSQW